MELNIPSPSDWALTVFRTEPQKNPKLAAHSRFSPMLDDSPGMANRRSPHVLALLNDVGPLVSARRFNP
jgi:hypothetical protein